MSYSLLLILTDGDITDMDETIEAIIEACEQPLSIIIVGLGESSFESMNILDADDGVLMGKHGNAKQHYRHTTSI